MLILDKRRAIERIMALSEGAGRSAVESEGEPPKGARRRIAAYEPKPMPNRPLAASVTARAGANGAPGAGAPARRGARQRQGRGAAFPV
jgi:hypothetical protein